MTAQGLQIYYILNELSNSILKRKVALLNQQAVQQ